MFGLITTFLAGPYGFLLKLGMVVLVLGGIWFAGVRFEHNRLLPKIEAAKSEADLWQQTADNRKTLIEAQNQAVESIKAAHDKRVADLNERLATAILEGRRIRMAAETKVKVLESLKLSENECTAVFQLIDEARK